MYDFHIHSEHSIHSKESMENMVHTGIHKGFKCLCFTEFIRPESFSNDNNLCLKKNRYFDNIKDMKYRFNDFINVLAGIEIEIEGNMVHTYDEFIKANPFDFVILSFKNQNYNLINRKENSKPIDIIINYYEYIYDILTKFNNFDVIGHFDYIDKLFIESQDLPSFDLYSGYIDRILRLLIERDKGIELNTSGYRLGLNHFFPKDEILHRYKDLGGKIITIGSDSKNLNELGYKYDDAMDLIKEVGFTKLHTFESRIGVPIKI